ncbi:MAG: hypothetical protein Q9195_002338 [Heterodermia aff. obscurata]
MSTTDITSPTNTTSTTDTTSPTDTASPTDSTDSTESAGSTEDTSQKRPQYLKRLKSALKAFKEWTKSVVEQQQPRTPRNSTSGLSGETLVATEGLEPSLEALHICDEEPNSPTHSLNDSVSEILLRPWSFMQVPATSQTHSGVNTDGSDSRDALQDGFDSSHLDRPTSHSISDTWTRYGDAGRGQAANSVGQVSAWTRYGEPSQEKVFDDTQIASGASGWWKQQMLVDRSLRSMAGLTSIFALGLMILSITYLPDLLARKSLNSTSVGSRTGQDCGSLETTNADDWACWIAFRTGEFPPVKSLVLFDNEYKSETYMKYFGSSTVAVSYDSFNCTQYKNTTKLSKLDPRQERLPVPFQSGKDTFESMTYGIGNCTSVYSITCKAQDFQNRKCRINVRMSALLTLTVCLMIKAAYMVAINVSLRRSVKSQCLTFGDVIVASAMDRDTRIYNECMVNAGDGYRHKTVHTCHKHCKDREPSASGDSIGHCQRCKKHNITDQAAGLSHPSVAIKYKKSLISSLGTTALVQMIILMFCSLAMLAISLFLAVLFGSAAASFKKICLEHDPGEPELPCTSSGEAQYLKTAFGTFGGFNSSAYLSAPSAAINEEVTFLIANGAQFLYSALYLLLIYNITLISMESDWGNLERTRSRLRCTLVKGSGFAQSYLLQLPKKVLYPMMAFSSVMHWLLGQAISARETIYADHGDASYHSEYSYYSVRRLILQ